jgi:hypothetical protein
MVDQCARRRREALLGAHEQYELAFEVEAAPALDREALVVAPE